MRYQENYEIWRQILKTVRLRIIRLTIFEFSPINHQDDQFQSSLFANILSHFGVKKLSPSISRWVQLLCKDTIILWKDAMDF